MQAVALEAGQATHHTEEKIRAESEKRRQADEEMSRLRDELKRKTKELESVKIQHEKDQSMLRKTIDDAAERYQRLEKKFSILTGSVHQFASAVFGKLCWSWMQV